MCMHVLLVTQDNIITVHSSLHVIIPLTQTGATPLLIASQNGHSDVVNILIRNRADVNLACNVWRYNHSHCITVYVSATAGLTCRSLNVHALWLVSYGYCRGFIKAHLR